MKRKSLSPSSYLVCLRVKALILAVALLAPLHGCAALNPKELTRSRALSLLGGHKVFRRPAMVPLRGDEKFPVPAESTDEEEPVLRAIERFYDDTPTMAVIRHFGLAEVTAVAVKRPEPLRYGDRTPWMFKVTPRLTERGREAVRAAGGEGEDGVPTFRREIVEITGLRKEGDARAEAEFTWKAVPTEVGEAFDPTSTTFKTLPLPLQQKIARVNILGNSLKMEFGRARRATASFQLYDDGWRVTGVSL